MNLYDSRSFAQNGRFSISPPGLFCPPADNKIISQVARLCSPHCSYQSSNEENEIKKTVFS